MGKELDAAWENHYNPGQQLDAYSKKHPPYLKQWQGEEWIQMCYYTGACATAIPALLAQDVELSKVRRRVHRREWCGRS